MKLRAKKCPNMVLMLLCMLFSIHSHADISANSATSVHYPDYQLTRLEEDSEGFLRNTSKDSYFSMEGLNAPRDQACNLKFSLDFKETLSRPALFEIFWAVADKGFKEAQKASFVVSHLDSTQPNSFIVPLCKLYNFSGNLNIPEYQGNISRLRFDFPSNRVLSVKFSDLELLTNADARNRQGILVEPYERIVGKSFTSLDAIIPKLIFAFEQGLKRLTIDKVFLVFWLLLILGLLSLIIRSYKRP